MNLTGFNGFFEVNGLLIPNTICKDGAEMYLKSLFQAAAVMPTNYYLGFTNADLDYDSELTDAEVGEPVGNGYARATLVRNNTDWTVEQINGVFRARSTQETFTASANWDKTWTRLFIANVASGAGKLVCVSGPAPSPVQVTTGNGPVAGYIYNIARGD